jgi:predicted transcriptional regulator
MSFSRMIEELRQAGLLDQAESPHLTPKGREWLRALEDAETQEVADLGEDAADLVLSTSGIFR